MFDTFAWIIVGFVGIIILILLNRRRKPALAKAYATYSKLTQKAGPEFEQLSQVFDRVREVVGETESFRQRGMTGDTFKMGDLVLKQVDGLEAMSAELHRVLSEGDSLLHPSGPLAQAANMMSSSRYLHCLNLLNGPSLQLSRFPGLDDMPGSSWVSFDQFLSLMRQRRMATQQNVDRFKSDLANMGESVAELETSLGTLDAIESRINKAGGHSHSTSSHLRTSLQSTTSGFGLPAIFGKLVTTLEKEIQKLLSDSKQDPVGVRNSRLPELQQKIEDATRIASVIEDAGQVLLPDLARVRKELTDRGYTTRWMDRRQRELEDEAERVLKLGFSGSITELSKTFESNVKKFSLQVAQTSQLVEKLEGPMRSAIDTAKVETKTARETIAKRLGISSSMALRETDYSPDDEIKRAEQQWLAAKASINRGDVTSVDAAIGEIEVETNEADKLIAGTLHAVDEFSGKHELLKEAAESLKQRFPGIEETVNSLKRRYDKEAFLVEVDPDNQFAFQVETLTVAQVVLEDSNSLDGVSEQTPQSLPVLEPTAEGNEVSLIALVVEATEWMRGLIDQLNTANRNFQSGRVLEACNVADLVEVELADLGQSLDRIGARLNHLQHLETQNESDWQSLATRINSLQSKTGKGSEQEQGRGGEASLESANALDRLVDEFENREAEQEGLGKKNPVKQRRWIDHFLFSIEEVLVLQQLEDESYQEVLDAVAGAEQELRVAKQLVLHSHGDGIPDSVQIANDQKAVEQSAERLETISKAIGKARGGFKELDQKVTNVQVELSMINGRLRQELKTAKQAADSVQHAAQVVFQAAQWRGDFNIVVVGRPGSNDLRAARAALAEGSYREAILLAQEAERNASNGIVAAQAQVTRHRRFVARRAREARQNRQRNNKLW